MPTENTWCRTDHHARPIHKLPFIVFLIKKSIIRTAYEQASRDDFFKIPNPCVDSPLSWLTLKSRLRKALNLPRSGGIAPAHATDALNKNIRLDLKINQSKSNICVAGEYNV